MANESTWIEEPNAVRYYVDVAASAEMPLESTTLPGFGHGIKPLGQIRDSYIVATDEEGLLLVDQHVAHERVLFEQFRDARLVRTAGFNRCSYRRRWT
jgi:DNA mismatch repair protein MutL